MPTNLTHDKYGVPVKPRATKPAAKRPPSMSVAQYRQLVAKAETETPNQHRMVRWLKLVLPRGSIVAAYLNERGPAVYGTEEQRRRYGADINKSGRKAGMPDLSFYVPGARVGFIEVKRQFGGRVEAVQLQCHTELRFLGFPVCVAENIDDIRQYLIENGFEFSRQNDELFV